MTTSTRLSFVDSFIRSSSLKKEEVSEQLSLLNQVDEALCHDFDKRKE